MANMPVMVDFGANKPERPLAELVTKKLRPGDIYTHVFSDEQYVVIRPHKQAVLLGRPR